MPNSQWSMSGAACIAISRQCRYEQAFGRNQFKGCMTKPPPVEGKVLAKVINHLLPWFLDQHSPASLQELLTLPANSLQQPRGAQKFW